MRPVIIASLVIVVVYFAIAFVFSLVIGEAIKRSNPDSLYPPLDTDCAHQFEQINGVTPGVLVSRCKRCGGVIPA